MPLRLRSRRSFLGAATLALLAATAAPALAAQATYRPMVERMAAEAGLPPALAHAVIMVESRYNAKATGRGVYGLMQIMPATARGMGYQGGAAGLYDAETNLRYGLKYLAGAYRLAGGDVCGTIMRYSGGHRATAMNAGQRAYCSKVKNHMAAAPMTAVAMQAEAAVPVAPARSGTRTTAVVGGGEEIKLFGFLPLGRAIRPQPPAAASAYADPAAPVVQAAVPSAPLPRARPATAEAAASQDAAVAMIPAVAASQVALPRARPGTVQPQAVKAPKPAARGYWRVTGGDFNDNR